MRNLALMLGILAVFMMVNGCEESAKSVEAEPVVAEQADVVEETTVLEETAEEVVQDEPTTEVDAPAQTETAEEEVVAEVARETEDVVEQVQEAVADTTEVTEADVTDPDAVVVTVNGQVVTEKEVAGEVAKRVAGQKTRMPAGASLPDSYAQQIRMRVVDSKVERILLNQAMADNNLNISDEQIMDEIKKIAGKKGQSMEDVEKEIANWGMTIDDLKEQILMQMQAKALMEATGGDIVVTDEDIQAFYDQNPQYFESKEQVQASHILIKFENNATEEQKAEAKAKIDGLLVQVKEGADFAELAKENSDCPSSAKGGDLGMFGRGQMVPPFEQAAFAMNIGDVSDVVETRFGYHIIKLIDKKEAGTTSFDEAKEQITDYLTQQKQREAWTQYNKTMHDEATIEYSAAEQAQRDKMQKAAAARNRMPIQPKTAPQPQTESETESQPE